MQAIFEDLERVDAVTSGVYNETWNAYAALTILGTITGTATAAVLAVMVLAFVLESRRLMLVSVFALPLAGIILWTSNGTLYGFWLTAHDICSASSDYVASSASERLMAQFAADVIPCPAPAAAATAAEEGRTAYVALIQHANAVISGAHVVCLAQSTCVSGMIIQVATLGRPL